MNMSNIDFSGTNNITIITHLDELARLFVIMDYIAFSIPAEACESYITDEEIAIKIVENAKSKILELTQRLVKLDVLEQFGVDNWSGYSRAMKYLKEIQSETN